MLTKSLDLGCCKFGGRGGPCIINIPGGPGGGPPMGGGPGGRVQNGGGLLIEGASGLYGSNRSKNRTKSCINLSNFTVHFNLDIK